MKVILGDLKSIDIDSGVGKVEVVKSFNEKVRGDSEIIVTSLSDGNLKMLPGKNQDMFIPATEILKYEHYLEGKQVYFELDQFPFYAKIKKIILEDKKPKGVFRYRRISNKENNPSLIASDLYSIIDLFGKPEDIQVKQTASTVAPQHTIVTINFGEGTMAHVEFTFSEEEHIELEWSGSEKIIIEFNSKSMSPESGMELVDVPLTYPVDTILETSYKIDSNLVKQFKELVHLVTGGAR